MMMLLRKHAVLWAGAGVLGLAGAATSLAAAGLGPSSAEDSPPGPSEGQEPAQAAESRPEGEPGAGGATPAAASHEPASGTAAVPGVPEGSPACENVGCGEVTNAGGVTLHLPQPAVDGITRAADHSLDGQAHAGKKTGGTGEPVDEDTATVEEDGGGEEPATEEVRGVPGDSPACENVGCGEVTNAGGVTLHLPQPAVDGINRAREHREAAQDKGQDTATSEEPGAVSGSKPGGRPDHAGPPDRAGKP
jgi:hypothetical protein